MSNRLTYRALYLGVTAILLVTLFWLDQTRTGPASELTRCNWLISRAATPAADVLIIGSSRSGLALDPKAVQRMLANARPDSSPRVERIALGHNPLRASHSLLDNYLQERGAPGVIVLEIMFMTERSVAQLAKRNLSLPPEEYIFRRDLNLMTFRQIINMPTVAMPFTTNEDFVGLWQTRLRGVVLRAGALLYQFLREPLSSAKLEQCDKAALTREPEWPEDFSFSYGDFLPDVAPDQAISTLETEMVMSEAERQLKDWQSDVSKKQRYPYDFTSAYRSGEMALLMSMLAMASSERIPVVLLPLPLYGHTVGVEDLQSLQNMLPSQTHVFEVYGQVQADLDKFWYDDAHVELYPAGALSSSILAQHLLDSGWPTASKAKDIDKERRHD